MRKIIYLMCFIPTLLFAQNNLDSEQHNEAMSITGETTISCQFKYVFELKKYSGLFMCPVLKPKMEAELANLNVCNIQKDEQNQIVVFELDSLFLEKDIRRLFVGKIGVPDAAIVNIKILENER